MSQRIITQEQHSEILRKAFDQVCNEADWKAPIDCIVPYNLANLYLQAIQFMTGTEVQSEFVVVNYQQMFRLTSVGYRMGPCGDH